MTGMPQARSIKPFSAPDVANAVAALVGCIERSPIRADAARAPSLAWAPAGYDETDVRILEWIASHRRKQDPPARLAA